jgi:hypothetical protein
MTAVAPVSAPTAAAALLGARPRGLADVPQGTGDPVMDYLTDDSIDLAYADAIRPVPHADHVAAARSEDVRELRRFAARLGLQVDP